MEPELYDRLFRCHDFILALKLFKEAANKLTDDDIEFMEKAFAYNKAGKNVDGEKDNG